MIVIQKLIRKLIVFVEFSVGTMWVRFKGVRVEKGAQVSLYCRIIKSGDSTIVIGRNSVVRSGAVLQTFGRGCIIIGDDCSIGFNTVVLSQTKIKLADFVRIGPQVTIVSSNHVFGEQDKPIFQQGWKGNGVEILSDCWIGAGVQILDGSCLGPRCVVAAGSTVTPRSFPREGILIGGVPAVEMRKI